MSDPAVPPGAKQALSPALLVAQVRDYAIIALDPHGVIQSWNLDAERVKGYSADEIIGRHFSVFYTEDDCRAGTAISVTVRSDGERVRLAVADRGRGIREEDLPTIFEEFQRGSLAEADGGAGLGLASVKQVARLHHGDVWTDSEVGRGTTVTVSLPCHQPG